MTFLLKKDFKYKLLSYDELLINLDRLTRFKLPELSFKKVFTSIVVKYLVYPKYSINEIENLSAEKISDIVKLIWNDSVKNIKIKDVHYKNNINSVLKILVNHSFKNLDDYTKTLVETKLDIAPILHNYKSESTALNLKLLEKLYSSINHKVLNINDIVQVRKKYGLLFPVEKLIIVEGITEEILLPAFAKKYNHDFYKEGIFILGAGGKSKSPSLYLQLKDKLKIPVNLLFDCDAKEIYNILQKILLDKDKALIIKNGEFEDIISPYLIKRALNSEYEPATPIIIEDLRVSKSMCDNIENFYKSRHLGEFKKSKVSKIIAKNIRYSSDISNEIKSLISEIL